MKPFLLFILIVCLSLQAKTQYYIRGAIYDESGKGIDQVKIFLSSKGNTPFYTIASGSFAIPVSLMVDTILLQADGFETVKQVVYASRYNIFNMRLSTTTAVVTKPKLLSLISKNRSEYYDNPSTQDESYSSLIEHDFSEAEKYPETGFALSIDEASYSNIRRFINNEMKVPPDAVRIEEMLNYFDFSKNEEKNSKDFTVSSQITEAPWNLKNELLFINIKAPSINVENVPPANLVFLLDVSGSMDQPNKLPLLKDAFKMLLNNLRAQDTVAIVVYGGNVGIYLQPTSCVYKDSIKNMIDKLEPGGETPGEAAIKTAYKLAERMYNRNANNRILLATDGDFNVGQTTDEELENIVVANRKLGIYLTCLGVGMGNYKDSKLETLAKKGNGNFAYLDNVHEAEKVLVTEFTKTMYAVADDAYATINFNPSVIKQYRLIGFDNKQDEIDDTTSELEGGEVGTGHSLVAVFEIERIKSDSISRIDKSKRLAQLAIHYRVPVTDSNINLEFAVQNNFSSFKDADSSIRFATAVIMFGGLLKQSALWKNYTWDDVIKITNESADKNNYVQTEFLSMIQKADDLYVPKKKKKKKKSDDK